MASLSDKLAKASLLGEGWGEGALEIIAVILYENG
jgi:hypothetical protein